MKKTILFLLSIFITQIYFSQNTCQTAQIFCPNPVITYPAGVNSGNAQNGPNYGCLGSQPNAAWYYLNVYSSGSFQISLSAANDIDYICYGPFNTLAGNCGNLTAANTVDCSYSGSASETLTIPNSNSGDYFLVLVTNFSNAVQTISLTQQGGTGILNCSGFQATTTPMCIGSTATITASLSYMTNPSYSLNPGALTSNTPTFFVSPSIATTYTMYCTGINTQSVVQTLTSTVNVNVVPSPTLSTYLSTPTICVGDAATLFVNGALTYTWSNGIITSNSSIIVSPTITTSYTVSGVAWSGCIDTAILVQNVVDCNAAGIFINNKEVEELNVFPNPANDKLVLSSSGNRDKEFTIIQIINYLGQIAKEVDLNFNNESAIVNVEDLPKGVYFLRLLDSARSNRKINKSKRFVIAR
jgi:hypothetical protein